MQDKRCKYHGQESEKVKAEIMSKHISKATMVTVEEVTATAACGDVPAEGKCDYFDILYDSCNMK